MGARELIPMAETTLLATIADSSKSTRARSTAPGDVMYSVLADGNDATYAYGDNLGGADSWWFECTVAEMPLAQTIESVTVRAKAQDGAGGTGVAAVAGRVRINGTVYETAWVNTTGTLADIDLVFTANPATLAAWTTPAVKAAKWGVSYRETGYSGGVATSPLISAAHVVPAYIPVPPDTDAARDLASRRIWSRLARSVVRITGGVRLLDMAAPGQRILYSEIAGPHATAEGWTTDPGGRHYLWVESAEWDHETQTVTLTCRDQRGRMCWLYDSGTASAAGPQRNGVMRISPGAVWTMTRASSAELLDATGQLVSVPANVEAHADQGYISQDSRTNYLKNSAWALGVDVNWTSSGEGSNGSDILADTSIGLWTQDLSARCLEIKGGSPAHAADLEHVADAVTGRTGHHAISIFHIDTGGPMSWALQRSVDSKWYRSSDSTWQASKTWNALTQRADWTRDVVHRVDVGGTSTSLTLRIGIPSATAVAGQLSRVAQAQIEAGRWAASPILTTDASVTRAGDSLTVSNNSGSRTLCVDRFTVSFEVTPFWSAADLTSSDFMTVFVGSHDSNNAVSLGYRGDTGAWSATLRVAGVNYTAAATHSPVAGVRYLLTVRLVGSAGELDKTPYTLELLVDGVPGTTTATASGPMTEASPAEFRIGHYASNLRFHGHIRQVLSSPEVLSDTEIERGI